MNEKGKDFIFYKNHNIYLQQAFVVHCTWPWCVHSVHRRRSRVWCRVVYTIVRIERSVGDRGRLCHGRSGVPGSSSGRYTVLSPSVGYQHFIDK